MRIAIDLDGVVVNMLKKWCGIYNKMYDDKLTEEQFWGQYNLGKNPIIKCGEKVYDIIHEKGFFEDIEPIEGAIEGVRELCEQVLILGGDVFIVSAFSEHPQDAFGKVTWVKKFMPWFNMRYLFLTCSKYAIAADILVDDSLDVLKEFSDGGGGSSGNFPILFDSPHNRNEQDFHRVRNWKELLDLINILRHYH